MSLYHSIIGRILCVIANSVMLLFGVLFLWTVFSGKTGTSTFTGTLGVVLGIATILGSLYGFFSTFYEYELTYLNYIAPVMHAAFAALLIYSASKSDPSSINCVIYVSAAATLIFGVVGTVLIVISESREAL